MPMSDVKISMSNVIISKVPMANVKKLLYQCGLSKVFNSLTWNIWTNTFGLSLKKVK